MNQQHSLKLIGQHVVTFDDSLIFVYFLFFNICVLLKVQYVLLSNINVVKKHLFCCHAERDHFWWVMYPSIIVIDPTTLSCHLFTSRVSISHRSAQRASNPQVPHLGRLSINFGPVYTKTLCFVFSCGFQMAPCTEGDVLKTISIHTRPQKTPESSSRRARPVVGGELKHTHAYRHFPSHLAIARFQNVTFSLLHGAKDGCIFKSLLWSPFLFCSIFRHHKHDSVDRTA